MRTIRILEHISLDGFISPPGDDGYANRGWTAPYRSPEGLQAVLDAQGTGFDLLLGRRTYDLWSGYWPNAGDNPMANRLNAATKYVATHRPDSLAWGPAKDLGADIMERIRSIKSSDGPDLVLWGSSTLTSMLLAAGLIDEVVLIAYPVLLGGGKRFFAEADARELALVRTMTSPTGLSMNTYRYVGALKKP